MLKFQPKKIVFLEPKSSHIHVYSDMPIPRLGVIWLATLAKERMGLDVQVFIEDVAPVEINVVLDADLVCISALTSTAPQSYRWADLCRAAGIPVILGGIHPTFLPQEALEHADFVLRGEAEESFLNFLDCLSAGGDLEKVLGLSWKDKYGACYHNPNQHLPTSETLDQLPFPDFRLVRGYERHQPAAISISTMRGCPFDCSFCSVTTFNGKIGRAPSVKWVCDAIEFYAEIYGDLRWIFFNDDIHNVNPRRMRELHQEMVRREFNFPWGTQVRHEISKDPRSLILARQAGVDRLFIGFESPWEKSLYECQKRQKVDDILRTVRAFKEYGIKMHGMFVAGFHSDPPDIVERIVDFSEKLGIETIQIMQLTMLPGSKDWRAFRQSEERLLTNNWEFFDGHHPTFITPNLTPLTLYDTTAKGFRRFYRLSKILRLLWDCVKSRDARDLRTVFIHLAGWRLVNIWPWRKENRLYRRFLKSQPEITGQTFEEWLIREQKLTIACPRNLHPTLKVFLKELGVNRFKLRHLQIASPNFLFDQKRRLTEMSQEISKWLGSCRHVHFVMPKINLGSDLIIKLEELANNFSVLHARRPRLICLSDKNGVRQALARLGRYLGQTDSLIQSAINKTGIQ